MNCLKYFAFLFIATMAYAQPSGTFELIAKYHGIGGPVATIVGPGPTPGSERFYVSYLYYTHTLEVLSIDPDTGNTEVFRGPAPEEEGARNVAAGPDGNLYFGTVEHARFLKLDPRKKTFTDLGRPSATETFMWDVTFGSDNRLYGVTYPNCKLVRYDPATGRNEDLGRLDATEQYARWIASSKDGFLYIGIGSSNPNIAAYEISTGKHREILPPASGSVGFSRVYRGADGNVYGTRNDHVFQLRQWTATELAAGRAYPAATPNAMRDGRVLSVSGGNGGLVLTSIAPKTHIQHVMQVHYEGSELSLFRIGFGPDGTLYGSSALPVHFIKIDVKSRHWDEIGDLGGGEIYSFLIHKQRLLMGGYSSLSPLMSYQPEAPFHPAEGSGNPTLVRFQDSDSAWRPQAMVEGPDGNVYVGAVAGYGKIEEPLVEWNVESQSVRLHRDVVEGQSITSLATWNNFIIGGTSIEGGGGSHPTQKEARLFMWDTKAHRVEFAIVPVPNAPSITDLIAVPDGRVYGIAANTLFVFDPKTRRITSREPLPFTHVTFNSIGVDKKGTIWGLAEDGIFAIRPGENKAMLIAHSPQKITGGFALRCNEVYFISGALVYRYRIVR